MDACTLFNFTIYVQLFGFSLRIFLYDFLAKEIRSSAKKFGLWCWFGGMAGFILIGVFTDAPNGC